MQSQKILVTICAFLISLTFISYSLIVHKKVTPPEAGFVLVELFTSEGCSSCPPADALAARMANETREQPVYILSYHVDYWNSLGWKDAFSNHDFSVRQYQYAQQLHLKTVYTPQVIVNGVTEFTGSNEIALRSAIQNQLRQKNTDRIVLRNYKVSLQKLSVEYTFEGDGKAASLYFALIEKGAETQVKAGENAGKNLAHVNIVRKLRMVPASQANGEISIEIPKDLAVNNSELVCFAQDQATGRILAAQHTAE